MQAFKKSLLAAAAFAGCISAAQAATTYAVSGVLLATTLTSFASFDPAYPTFSGFTVLDDSGATGANSFVFAPYTLHFGEGSLYRPDYTVTFNGGTPSWNGNTLTISGLSTSENTAGDVYTNMAPLPAADDSSSTLEIVFADAAHFSGTSYEVRHSQGLTFLTSYSITGIAVPVPSAAWLFGSALFGLTGLARKRKTA